MSAANMTMMPRQTQMICFVNSDEGPCAVYVALYTAVSPIIAMPMMRATMPQGTLLSSLRSSMS